MTYLKSASLLALCLFLLPAMSLAQTAMTLQDNSAISIDGTSTLHDWTMTMEQDAVEGEAQFKMNGNAIEGIEKLSISMMAEGLKSGKGAMDNNAYKALNTKDNPKITFVMKELASMENNGETYNVEVTGDMSVAGATKEVTLPAACTLEGGTVKCTGSFTFNMTEFGVKPPSVMLGTIKTGDELVLNYEAVFAN